MKVDRDLDSALNQIGRLAGIASHPDTSRRPEATGPMDATLLLSELMGIPVMMDSSGGGGGGVSRTAPANPPFLTDLPENGFIAGFSDLASNHYAPGNHYVTSPMNVAHPQSAPICTNHSPMFGNGMGISAGPITAIGSIPSVGSIAPEASVATSNSPKATALARPQAVAGLTMVPGAGAKGRVGTGPNFPIRSPGSVSGMPSYDDEERQKREMHNFIERRRRYNINDRIKELGSLLPGTEPDTRQNKGNILKTTVSYIKKLQKTEARHRELSRKHRQYVKTLTVFKSRLEEYDAACQSNGIVVPSASQEAALLTRVDLARVTLDQCVTLVDCLDSGNGECSDTTSNVSGSHSTSSNGASEEDEGWSEDDDTGTPTQEKCT